MEWPLTLNLTKVAEMDFLTRLQGICYVTDSKFIEECRREWEKRTNNAIVEYLVVPRLPRDANVEWQVWVHKHNTAFECKFTTCHCQFVCKCIFTFVGEVIIVLLL